MCDSNLSLRAERSGAKQSHCRLKRLLRAKSALAMTGVCANAKVLKELWIYRFFLGLLFFAGSIIIHQPADLSAQTGMAVFDDTLVYEARISSLDLVKDATSIASDVTTHLKVYPFLNNQEALTASDIRFAIPFLNYQGQMTETRTGVYELAIFDQLKIIFTDAHTSLPQIEQWQIDPLSCYFSIGDQTKIEPTGNFASQVGTIIKTFEAFVSRPSTVRYIDRADLNASINSVRQYQIDFVFYLRARLFDENQVPVVNHTVSATLEIPGRNYLEAINITTDSEGVFTYTRQGSAIISVAGGNFVTLSTPFNMDGVSFVPAQELVTVTGTVTQNGFPLPGAAVYINGNSVVYTDQAGIYRAEAGAGVGTITVYGDSGEFISEKTFSLTAGEIVTANFDFIPRVVKGKVTKNGVSLPRARIWAGRNKVVFTDSLGNYSANVQGEKIKISAFTATGAFINEQVLVNGISNTANFDFQPAFVTGIVRENGSPLGNAKVYAQFNEPFFTDVSGKYSFEAKSGPTRVVSYTIADEFVGEKMVTLVNGETVVVDFDFNPVTITGTVFEGGAAVPMAHVYAGANMPVTADALGRYTTRVQSGTWKVFAENTSADQIGETTIQVTPPDTVTVNVP